MVDKSVKNKLFSNVHGLEYKELEGGDILIDGYISTTHEDQGFYDPDRQVYIKDRVAKETLEAWRDDLNEGLPRANKLSILHNREPEASGVAIKGSARVDSLPDGEFGLFVETLVDSTKDTFGTTKSRLDKRTLDAFSIEFTTRDALTGEYLSGAVKEVQSGDGILRTIYPGTKLDGYTLAAQPMNEYAIRFKSLDIKKEEDSIIKELKTIKEDIKKMVETKEEQVNAEAPKEGEAEAKEEVKTEEASTEEESTEEAAPVADEVTEEDKKLLSKYKAIEAKEKKASETKALSDSIKTELIKELKSVKLDNKVMFDKEVKEVGTESIMEYKSMMDKPGSRTSQEQFKIAGQVAMDRGFITDDIKTSGIKFGESKMRLVNNKMEYKLGIDTNQNTDTDYLLSSAELRDVFDPVIFNILNQKTTTWNILRKEDFSGKGNNQVQFILKTAANTSAGAYTGNAINTADVTRLKYMTKFKKYQAGITVDGDMMAAASPSDVFAQEVSDSTDDLMDVINTALFAEVGLETAAGIIGFEYITDQAGNTSLYNLTRSQANGLSSTTVGDNYINGNGNDITLSNLRAAKRKAVGTEGADLNNMFYVTSFIQGDKFRGIYDTAQRPIVPSARVGFEGLMSFDGIPIFEDKDCNDDDWFLVDLETHKIGIWVPPTLEMLGKDSDSQKGFIKTYFATFNKAPRRMVQIYNNATS